MSFILDGGVYNWIIENGSNTYSVKNLISGTLQEGLYQTASVGNTPARQLDVSLWLDPDDEDYPGALDTTQPIVLKLKKIDADGTETIVNKGVYFFDTVEASPYSFQTDFTAFDAILKTEVAYMASGSWAQRPDWEVVQEVASDIGVTINSSTSLYFQSNAKTISETPSVGPNGVTDREMLSIIAVMHGGNWVINDANELEFIPLVGVVYSPVMVFIDTNGAFQFCTFAEAASTWNAVVIDANGRFQSTPIADVLDTDYVWTINRAGENETELFSVAKKTDIYPAVSVEIGDEVMTFDVSPTEEVRRIELQVNSSTYYRSPSGLSEEAWEALGGKCITASLPIMASQALADELLSKLGGYEYVPYQGTGVYVDADVPLGTALHIKDSTVIMSNRTLSIDTLASSDLSAEPTEQIQSVYPYISPVVRQIARNQEQTQASITVLDNSITSEVTRATTAEESISSKVTQTADEITTTFTKRIDKTAEDAAQALDDYQDYVQTIIRESADGIEIGKVGSNLKAILSNTQLTFTGIDGQAAAWLNNNQLNINEAVIHKNIQMGRWVQQTESNGAFSIVFVG